MDRESLQSASDAVQQEERFVVKTVKRELGFRRIVMAQIDPSYTGGNPKLILDAEDDSAAAPNEQFPILLPYGGSNIRPSGVVVVMEVAPGEFVVLGEIGSMTEGKQIDDSQWMVPSDYPTTETTISTTSASLLRTCPKTMNVNKVVFQVTTGVASQTARVKLFSADGTTAILDTGAVSVASNGRKTATLSPAVRIYANVDYRVEITCTDGTVAFRATAMSADGPAFINEGINARTTNGGGGSAVNTTQFPWIKFMEV